MPEPYTNSFVEKSEAGIFFFKPKAIEVDHGFHFKMIYWNKVILIDTQRHHTGCFTWSYIEPRNVTYHGMGVSIRRGSVCIGKELSHQNPLAATETCKSG